VVKFGKADKSETWAEDKLRLTVVKGLGDKKYFHAARDYIMENNTLLFTDEKKYGGETMRVVVMREEAATMKTFETFYRTPKLYGIGAVVGANTDQTVIVNGNFTYGVVPTLKDLRPSTFPKMTGRCNGILIQNGARNNSVSTDSAQAAAYKKPFFNIDGGPSKDLCGPFAKHLAQLGSGAFTFTVGEVPVNAGYREAIGGLTTNYASAEDEEANLIGRAVINHGGERKLIFTAQTDVNVSPDGSKGNGTIGLKSDVEKASPNWVILTMDGASSVALAYADPNSTPTDTLTVQYGGIKTLQYYVNTFVMFKCQKPR